ncbi:facilitated trehalose transporter Tret1-like isoform X2 [Photinus pyralis]|nr:facilitated trehalose transporter Tret1-like isoform X2 [Photinus pyralis]XP_031344091.1 facilitated trehalose transporter Tret1-like isoform X2 [Photinus pyralis]XP_031344092.1 facilitated trehalose transporter Tret1-like isoform X2 [Photinus pyralis]XP_031344093.1 facilitated trehalose transporter Tret1-like isoform X2 [Photinus pyralis]
MLVSNGMVAGFPIILIPKLSQEHFGASSNITEDQMSWMGSISFTCSLIGCLVSGFITQPIGRTRSVQVVAPLLFLAWIIFPFANEVWHIYLALCLCGFACSLVEAPILAYKSEVCQPYLRGMLSATSTLSAVTGTLIQIVLGASCHWRTAALISSSFPALTCVLLFYIPESPHWLVMHNKEDAAHVSLAWLRGWTTLENVQDEFEAICCSCSTDIQKSVNDSRGNAIEPKPRSKLAAYTKKGFLWPLGLMEFIFFLSHFTGNTTLQTYAVSLFETMRAPMDDFHATVVLGVAEVVGCLISLFFVRAYGKRIMTFVSLSGIGICNVVIATYAYRIGVKYLELDDGTVNSPSSHYHWIPSCLLILLAFIGHCGIRVLPWVLLGEVFPHETRAVGCGLGSASYNLMIFLANKLFINMVNGFTMVGVYVFYAVISFVGLVYLYVALPETEGKNLEDVINHFSEVAMLDNNIQRRDSNKAHYSNVC